jgi:hypothetical protein
VRNITGRVRETNFSVLVVRIDVYECIAMCGFDAVWECGTGMTRWVLDERGYKETRKHDSSSLKEVRF